MDSLASRLYYVDPNVIVSDAPNAGGPVMYFRNGILPRSELKTILHRLHMRIASELVKPPDGNAYYKLEVLP